MGPGTQTIDFLSIVSIPLFFVILVTGTIQIGINSIIQKNLLAVYNFKFPFKNILLHNFISTMYLLVIPGFFAPDFYLGYYYGKREKDYGRIVSALFINRAIGFILFSLLAGISILLLGPKYVTSLNIEKENINTSLIFFIMVICLGLSLIIWIFLKEKIKKILSKINQIWQETRDNKSKLWNAFFLKLGFNIIGVAGRVAIGYLLGINIPIWEFICVILTINFVIALPISLNGVGLREAGYIGMLAIIGVPKSTAFIFALSEFGITLSVALIGAIIFLAMKVNQVIFKLKN